MYTAKRDAYYSKEPWTLAGGKGGTNFALDSYEKFRLAFQDKKKGQRSWGRVLVRNSRKKATRRNTKLITFAPIIALVTPKVVSLQLNGMLMMWKIQQAMQEDAIQVAIIYQGNRAEMFISENFQFAYRDPGWKNRDLGNRASPPSHTNTSKISQRI